LAQASSSALAARLSNTSIFETVTARLGLNDDGVVIVRIRTGAHQTLADAEENLAAALKAREGRRRPLLVDINGSQPLAPEVRHHDSGQVLIDGFLALAHLIDGSPLGRMTGNVYFRIARPGIPTQLFTHEPRAIAWLKGYLP
jgi:hypothetical protein